MILSIRAGFIFAVVIIYAQKKSDPETHAKMPYCWEKIKGNRNKYYFILDLGLVLFHLPISKVKEACNKLSCLTVSWQLLFYIGEFSCSLKNIQSLIYIKCLPSSSFFLLVIYLYLMIR